MPGKAADQQEDAGDQAGRREGEELDVGGHG